MLIEDEIFRSDSWAIQAVNVVANSYPKQIVIVSAEARNELQQFPSIIADAAGTTQRYAGVEQLGAPSRRAREHYITTNFATDNIIIYLFRAKSHFPRAGISAWIHGYDTLNYIFNWMNEVAVAVDNSSA